MGNDVEVTPEYQIAYDVYISVHVNLGYKLIYLEAPMMGVWQIEPDYHDLRTEEYMTLSSEGVDGI